MSKNKQRNQSEINLGHETYTRGYGDGIAGHPKTIKKTHRHVHRYHIGYRHGAEEYARNMKSGLHLQDSHGVTQVMHQKPVNPLVATLIKKQSEPTGFWGLLKSWLIKPKE
jgi:hypothetical protein